MTDLEMDLVKRMNVAVLGGNANKTEINDTCPSDEEEVDGLTQEVMRSNEGNSTNKSVENIKYAIALCHLKERLYNVIKLINDYITMAEDGFSDVKVLFDIISNELREEYNSEKPRTGYEMKIIKK